MAIGSGGTPAIPGFEYLSVLGSGGFSDVLLYQQKLPRRRVAVKVLHVDQLDRQARRQFVAEANLMAQLSSHPAIATIYAADITKDGQPYLVMEYCSGGSLGATYRAAPLDVPEALRVGIRLASALEAAHRLDIVHRDVKPANILITDYGVPVLTDFGISVGDDGVAEASMFADQLTATATSVGSSSSHGMSVPWAPPEAFEDEPIGDERSDIYSLGATIFSLLEGRTPFEITGGKNGPVQLSRRIEKGEITPSTRTDVPDALRAAIAKSMSVSRDDRYPSALQLAEDLQRIQESLGEPITPIELPVTSTTGTVSVVAATPGPADESEQTRVRVPGEASAAPVIVPAIATPPAPISFTAPAAPPPLPGQVPPVAQPPLNAPYQVPYAQTATGPTPPNGNGGGNGKRIAILASVTALIVILVGVGAAVGISAIINGANDDTTTSRDRDRDRDDDPVDPDPEPTETGNPGTGTVAACDTDTTEVVAEVWEIEIADVQAFDDAPVNPILDAGIEPACGFFVTDSPAFENSSLQSGYFEAGEENLLAIVAAYTDAEWECTGPEEYTSFTAYSCSAESMSVSIYSYKEGYTFGAPDALPEDTPYIATSMYIFD